MKLEGIEDLFLERNLTVVAQAIASIEKKRLKNEDILKTKWPRFNATIGGGLEFETNLVIGARPRTGKSALMIQLMNDICEVNNTENLALICYTWEMTAVQQAMRTISSKLKLSVKELKSNEQALGKYYLDLLRTEMAENANYPIYYAGGCTSKEIVTNTAWIKKMNPGVRLINFFDHSRLVRKTNEKSEEERLTGFYMACNEVKKMDCINIILTQLNKKLDDDCLHSKKGYRAPVEGDVFGADAAFQFADNMILLHRPELYSCDLWDFGDRKISTENKMWGEAVKVRDGSQGVMTFDINLAHNIITQQDFF